MRPVWLVMRDGVDLGSIPDFLDDADPRPAREQIDENYAPGGGWRPIQGFKVDADGSLHFPGDPPLEPLAITKLREEMIMFYRHAFVAIVSKDGAEVARLD